MDTQPQTQWHVVAHSPSSMIKGIAYSPGEPDGRLFVKFNDDSVYDIQQTEWAANNIYKPLFTLYSYFVPEGEKLDGSVGKLYNRMVKAQPSIYNPVRLSPEVVANLRELEGFPL